MDHAKSIAKMNLSEEQIESIRLSFISGHFSKQTEIQKLVTAGFTQEEATTHVEQIADKTRKKLFEEKMKAQKNGESQQVAMAGVIVLGLIGPLFAIENIFWYVLSTIAAGGIGFWSYKNTPIAGMIGCALAVLLMPFTCSWYISNRDTILRIELLIPVALAALPAYIVGLIISKIAYTKHN